VTPITIALVDDHPLFLEGVTSSFARHEDLRVVATGGSAADAISIAHAHHPDILLLDISLPGGGAMEAIARIAASARTKVLILTAADDVATLTMSLQRGASGFIVKGVGVRELVSAVRDVHSGLRYVSPLIAARASLMLANRSSVPRLTRREREIVDLVADGLPNKRIAARLELQEKTVKHHMTEILRKLGAANRTEAALRWRSLTQASTGVIQTEILKDPDEVGADG